MLSNYVSKNYEFLYKEYYNLEKRYSDSQAVERLLLHFNLSKTSIGVDASRKIMESIVSEEFYYASMSIFREKVRKELEDKHIDVSLEDVFTSFDKSILSKEYMQKYSYAEMDEIRQSIMRLFTFYFGQTIQKHSFEQIDYLAFVNYIKKLGNNVSIITMNWDTLLEGYFKKYTVGYDLCLNGSYFVYDDLLKNTKCNPDAVGLIKLHGSINWLRCLRCNTLSILEIKDSAKYLFDDDAKEECIYCHNFSQNDAILLQPEIITPTMIKSINSQLYNNLWNAAHLELMKSSQIFFIGYSLPAADYEFRYLLQKSIPSNANIHVILYKDDDPSQIEEGQSRFRSFLPEKRYKDLFSKNKISFHYEGFKEYFT